MNSVLLLESSSSSIRTVRPPPSRLFRRPFSSDTNKVNETESSSSLATHPGVVIGGLASLLGLYLYHNRERNLSKKAVVERLEEECPIAPSEIRTLRESNRIRYVTRFPRATRTVYTEPNQLNGFFFFGTGNRNFESLLRTVRNTSPMGQLRLCNSLGWLINIWGKS